MHVSVCGYFGSCEKYAYCNGETCPHFESAPFLPSVYGIGVARSTEMPAVARYGTAMMRESVREVNKDFRIRTYMAALVQFASNDRHNTSVWSD